MLGLGLRLYSLPRIQTQVPVLNQINGSIASYSLRKIRKEATNVIRVRRSSDNDEADIGFTGLGLNIASLTSFVGANNGFITKWYDQSDNSNDITQLTAGYQPRIVNAGAVEVSDTGKPCIYFDGVDDELRSADNAAFKTLSMVTMNSVSKQLADYGGWGYVQQNQDVRFVQYSRLDQKNNFIATQSGTIGAGTVDNVSGYHVNTGVFDSTLGSSRIKTFVNGLLTAQDDGFAELTKAGGAFLTVGRPGWEFHNGYFEEIILFNAALTDAQRAILEQDQINYYGVI